MGVETWRCLVLLAIHTSITAQQVSQTIGMDKAAVSRCFKGMQAKKLITMGLNEADGRLRVATLTAAGRALHDEIRDMALERERALLSALSQSEQETLLRLLKRLHENLPAVEKATAPGVARRYPHAGRPWSPTRRRRGVTRPAPACAPGSGFRARLRLYRLVTGREWIHQVVDISTNRALSSAS